MLDFTQNLMHSQMELQLPKTTERGLKFEETKQQLKYVDVHYPSSKG